MLAAPESTELEQFAQVFDKLASARLSPSVTARVIARVRWSSLDAKLVNGADPAGSPSLAARSALLTSRREREVVADGLEKLVARAHGPQRRWWAVARHGPVRANAERLTALAEVLRSGRPLRARGIALLNVLLTDGCGPCYRGDPARLADSLRRVRELMAA